MRIANYPVALLALVLGGCLPPPAPQPIYPAAPVTEPLPEPRVTISGSTMELNQAIYFAFNSDHLLPISFPILNEVARVMQASPHIERVRIEGHTDNVGTPTYNLMLSQRRAQSVASYLEHRGVASERLLSAGFGQDQPVADNLSEEGRARNRRVKFVITREAPPAPRSIEHWQRSASLSRGRK